MNDIYNVNYYDHLLYNNFDVDSAYADTSLIRGIFEYKILTLTIPALPGVSGKVSHKLILQASYPNDIQGDAERELKGCLKASLTDGMQVLALSAVAASAGGPIAMMSAVTASITPALGKVRNSFIDCINDIASLKNISNQVKIDIVHKNS